MAAVKPLPPEALCRWCDPDSLGFKTTEELEDPPGVVGQDRAVAAVEFGIGIDRAGYNMFCLGPTGTGKHRIINDFLSREAAGRESPPDWAYVNNFAEPHKPRAISFPTGRAMPFRDAMAQLVDDLRAAIPAAFESEDYQSRRKLIEDEFKGQHQDEFEALQKEAQEKNIGIMRTPAGFVFVPVRDGEPIKPEVFNKMAEKDRERFKDDIEKLQEKMEALMRRMPTWEKDLREQLRKLNRETTERAVHHLIQAVRDEFGDIDEVPEYLDEVEKDVIKNAFDFVRASGETPNAPQQLQQLIGRPNELVGSEDQPSFRRYQVNVIVHNGNAEGAPVIHEDPPTLPALVGRIEHTARYGALTTDFTLIKPGALHKANGGYLIIDARKVLMQPMAWEELKRTLINKEIRIDSLPQLMGYMSTVSLEPEPIPLDLKIVLVGEPMLYYLLSSYDPDFPMLFKVQAEFQERMDLTEESLDLYARLIAMLARWEDLPALNQSAVARIIEEGSRQAADNAKLSTRFTFIQDLLREADYWKTQAGESDVITDEHVQKAIDAQIYRADRLRELMYEQIERETILIDTTGERVGQVNGLAVLQLGGFAFGKPTRITARVRLGKGEVVDIERRVDLGGPLHSKGVMILTGYLGAMFAQKIPLALAATMVFEQSYGGVDGDSASSTELYALLSALSQIPIKQQFAVTGSVNQFGEVQAIGSANEKIEGYFDICRLSESGLTGEQGVLIPKSNMKHLMLRRDVVEACREGRFNIYAISTIEEGIELLTGVPAGEFDADGNYPPESVFGRVQARLEDFARMAKEFGKPVHESGAGEESESGSPAEGGE